MNRTHAQQIADLLNSYNELSSEYDYRGVLNQRCTYITYLSKDTIVGCVAFKNKSWYQCEAIHLSVDEHYRGKGIATRLLNKLETFARKREKKVIQSTVRCENEAMVKLNEKLGYKIVNQFSGGSGRSLYIFQKVLV